MLVEIPHVLGHTQLEQVRTLLGQSTFRDGAASAETRAAAVKQNTELCGNEPHRQALDELVMGNLVRHPRYRAAALPRHVATPIYARYRSGQAYGPHIDNPLMGAPQTYRADIAITLFLNDPDSYTGGELVIDTELGEHSVKLQAGHAVIYPASFTHRVNVVSNGERLVAVTWVQSFVRDSSHRRVLFELSQTREELRKAKAPEASLDRLDAVYANLIRLWAET